MHLDLHLQSQVAVTVTVPVTAILSHSHSHSSTVALINTEYVARNSGPVLQTANTCAVLNCTVLY